MQNYSVDQALAIVAAKQAQSGAEEKPRKRRLDRVFFRDENGDPLIVSRAVIYKAKQPQQFIGRLPPTLQKGSYLGDIVGSLWIVTSITHFLGATEDSLSETIIRLKQLK